MKKIEEYIPIGKDNAVSRQALCIRTGLADRENRNLIQEARDRGIPIAVGADGGYYIANTAADVERIQRDYRSRAYKMLSTAIRLDAALASLKND